MEINTALITFLEKHVNCRHLLVLIGICVAFWLGFEYNNAVRDKADAELILTHAKEITAYRDSAFAAKQEAHNAISTYKWMMFYQDRTIDSLKNVIKLMENENKD
ncbi:MAG: hypothetical protein K2H72_03180 [Muribaculaceae bacterium]|nr:hypothetical protein [Muribaculaceae bacterium]